MLEGSTAHGNSNRSDEHEYEKNAEEERKNCRHDANIKLSEGLTPKVLHFKAIEALYELSTSPNSKLIITNGRNPLNLDLVYPSQTQKDSGRISTEER